MMEKFKCNSKEWVKKLLTGCICTNCGRRLAYKLVDKWEKDVQPVEGPTEYEHGVFLEIIPCRHCCQKSTDGAGE